MKDHTKICCVCATVMHKGKDEGISHGYCPPCYRKERSKWDAIINAEKKRKEEAA